MGAQRRALTLIEILVVVSVVLVLASLLIPAATMLRQRAREALTAERMQAALTAFHRLGAESENAAFGLQAAVPALGGTLVFARGANADAVAPEGGAAWHATWPALTDPVVRAYPWGAERAYPLREAWYAAPQGLSTDPPTDWSAAERDAWRAAEPLDLGQLSPVCSGELLVATGVAPGLAAYRGDRDPDAPWNDAWGHPLIVGAALFQPPVNRLGGVGRGPDFYLRAAREAYGFNRAVYLAIGAIGRRAGAGVPADAAGLQGAWDRICAQVMDRPELVWDQRRFADPPWEGIRFGGSDGERCALSAPATYR